MIAAFMVLAVIVLLAPHLATLVGSLLGGSAIPRQLVDPSAQDGTQEKGGTNE